MTISEELGDIVIRWLRDGFPRNQPLGSHLRLMIDEFASDTDKEFVENRLYARLEPLQIELGIYHLAISDFGDALLLEIALTEDTGIAMMWNLDGSWSPS
jgi:hypothetical protein